MNSDTNLLILPYSAVEGQSLLHILIDQFQSRRWTHFRAAIAFARTTGNFEELLNAMHDFATRGNKIEVTFGANRFGGEAQGSSFEAIEVLLTFFKEVKNVRFYLYFEKGRTFHPKIYLFSNDKEALLISGSSNWSGGGLYNNVEANTLLRFDLTLPDHKSEYAKLEQLFNDYWQEVL